MSREHRLGRRMSLGILNYRGYRCADADPTPPSGGLIIEYRQPGGPRVSHTVAATDLEVTINASKDDDITVMYSASDPQGVRSATLVYDMKYYSGVTLVSPLLAPIEVTSNCPKELLLNTKKFGPDGHPWQYSFSTRAENWLGANAQTPTVKILTQ